MPAQCLLVLVATLQLQGADPRLAPAVTLDGEHPFTVPATAMEWNERAEQLRRRVRLAAGLWPWPERTLLSVQRSAPIDRGDYTIERIAFESQPGHVVTGNLYLPMGDGPFPAVLTPHGHWDRGRLSERGEDEVAAELATGGEWREENARYHLQARCATFARMGCVVLQHDMVGYADSRALPHGSGFSDVEALLRGQSAFGLQTWNSIRAFDLLASLPQVDARRIAVTGGSGGGTQTFVLCAIDPRPAVSAPAVMVSTTMQGGCVCENAPYLRVGVGNVELAALVAPRPLGLTGANDWTVALEERGLPELRSLYERFGVPGRVEGWVHPEFGHNYNAVSRVHVYGFLDRHLELGLDLEEHPLRAWAMEERFVPVPPSELSLQGEEEARLERLDVQALRERWNRRQEERLAALVPRDAGGLREWREVIGGALSVLVPAELPEAVGVVPADAEGRVWLETPGARVRITVHSPAGSRRGALLLAGGSEGLALQSALDQGFVVIDVETLLEDSGALPVDGSRHGNYAGYTWGYNEVLLAQRVRDVLVAASYAKRLLPSRAPLVLFGSGWAGPGALLAAARVPGLFSRVAVTREWTFADLERLEDPRMLPGALAFGGIPGLGSLHAPGELAFVAADPPDCMQAVWRAEAAQERLTRLPDVEAALSWLCYRP